MSDEKLRVQQAVERYWNAKVEYDQAQRSSDEYARRAQAALAVLRDAEKQLIAATVPQGEIGPEYIRSSDKLFVVSSNSVRVEKFVSV